MGILAAGLVAFLPAGVAAQTVTHDLVDCMEAGKYPVIGGSVTPSEGVKVEVYFKSALSGDWYKVEATLNADGTFTGTFPYPTVEASPVTYYIAVNGVPLTAEQAAKVIEQGSDCEGNLAPVAAFGPGALAALGGGLPLGVVLGVGAGVLGAGAGIADRRCPPSPAGDASVRARTAVHE